jgi:hypothetical protein
MSKYDSSEILVQDKRYIGDITTFKEKYPLFTKFKNQIELLTREPLLKSGKIGAKSSQEVAECILMNDKLCDDFGNIAIVDVTNESEDYVISLLRNMHTKVPIRVIRGKALSGDYNTSPDAFRYDGLYWVTFTWKERNSDNGHLKIRLVRGTGQSHVPKYTITIDKSKATKIEFDPEAVKKYSLLTKLESAKTSPNPIKFDQKNGTSPVIRQSPVPQKSSTKSTPPNPSKPSPKSVTPIASQKQIPPVPTKSTLKSPDKILSKVPTSKAPVQPKLVGKAVKKPPTKLDPKSKIPVKSISRKSEEPPQKKKKPDEPAIQEESGEEYGFGDSEDEYESDFIDDSESHQVKTELSGLIKHLFPTRTKVDHTVDLDDIEEVRSFSTLDEEEQRSRKIAIREDKKAMEMDEKRRKERDARLSKK